ncbi:hypothetical protein BOW10_12265 [Solemya velum gill symbiont]|nr:hypothetical protein BOV92_14235 [Solemya velum gill symbiont]OOY74539.1 hypothetical protein BOW10_12265 [Solemya velum gill symbiont]
MTASLTCSGFMYIGIARMKQPGDGACDVLNLMGQGATIFTNSFFNTVEYVHVVDLVSLAGAGIDMLNP